MIRLSVCQMLLDLQYTEISRHVYEIRYQIHLRPYRFRVKYKMGPSPYQYFWNEDGQNITDQIVPYIGPNHDFHKIEYTPHDFGHRSILVEYLNGHRQLFREFEVIGEEDTGDGQGESWNDIFDMDVE